MLMLDPGPVVVVVVAAAVASVVDVVVVDAEMTGGIVTACVGGTVTIVGVV